MNQNISSKIIFNTQKVMHPKIKYIFSNNYSKYPNIGFIAAK